VFEKTAAMTETKQAIAGVAPRQLGEVTVMTVWPTMAALAPGRMLGLLYARNVHSAWGNLLTFKNLVVLVTLPIPILFWAWGILPFRCLRYRLTNRRLIIARGYTSVEVASVGLDQFDTIETQILPGQDFFHAGDLVFKRGPIETFRLQGVSRPETFRQTCLKANQSYVGVTRAMKK
jgi:hypothetical protein